MRIINIIALFAFSLLIFQSCDKSELEVKVKEGGLVEVQSPSLNYVVGNPGPYTSSLRVFQGSVKTTKIEIYKTFYTKKVDATDGTVTPVVSNTVMFKTLDISASATAIESFEFTFDELVEGLTTEDGELPASDGDYSIGDYWEFVYHATTSDGKAVEQNRTTKVTVATRFAGKYKCISAVYGRYIEAESKQEWFYTEADWPAETLIESVDATTYRVLEYFGPQWFDGNDWYFQVDPETSIITYPETKPDGSPQVGNDQPFISCHSDPAYFALMDFECGDLSNIIIKDDVNGKDRLYMTYGYYTAGSGPRTLHHVLEKIVE